MEGLKLVAKGAEADLWVDEKWNGVKVLIKIRCEKRYRHPELDNEIRRMRTMHEASIIHRAKEVGVPTPLVYQISPEDATIVMEYVEGDTLRDIVDDLPGDERLKLIRTIGGMAGRLHKGGIVHGDLTTSNLIITPDGPILIDFGLSEMSTEVEKRGVDLNLMRRMLASTHFRHSEELFASFKEGYRKALGAEADNALSRMEEISKRGRYVERE